ncbi:MAG: hypothetical protein N2Z62_06960 [Rhodobacteraceae bacterium]|nr:hypothetical protein [Paracoccaceae bacterium]
MPRLAALVLAGLALAGCAAGVADPVRPGATSALDQDALSPPSGARYDYTLRVEGDPAVASLALVSRRLSADRYRYDGSFATPLPAGLSPEVRRMTAEMMREMFGGEPIRFTESALIVPVGMETDRRFRARRTSMLMGTVRHIPHDCFAQLGTCRSTMRGAPGEVRFLVETTEADGIWRSITRASSRELPDLPRQQEAVFSIDANGVLFDADITTTMPDGTVERMQLRRVTPEGGP